MSNSRTTNVGSDTTNGLTPVVANAGGGPGADSPNHKNSQRSTTSKKKHPPPVNKKAKEHLRVLQRLGYTNLTEPGIPYWEARLDGETKPEHNARRQRECEAMEGFIAEKLANRSLHEISISEDTAHTENSLLQEQLEKAEIRYKTTLRELESERALRLQAESENRKAEYKTKQQSPLTTSTQDFRNIAEQLEKMTAELAAEKRQRKKLEDEVHRLTQLLSSRPPEPLGHQTETEKTIGSLIDQKLDKITKTLTEYIKNSTAKKRKEKPKPQPQGYSTPGTATTTKEEETVPPKFRGNHRPPPNLRINIPEHNADGSSIGTAGTFLSTGSMFTHDRTREYAEVAKQPKTRTEPAAKRTNNPRRLRPSPQEADKDIRRPETIKILALPRSYKKVTEELQDKKIRPRTYGVSNVVEFASGAALLTIEKEKARAFKDSLHGAGVQIKERTALKSFSIKIHGVPNINTEDDIREDVAAALGSNPISVHKVLYKLKDNATPAQNGNVVMVAVECSREMLTAAEKRQSLLIGYRRCRIDTTPQLMKCKKCTLLGHTQNHCEGVAADLQAKKQSGNFCLDCLVYNDRITRAGLPKYRHRPVTHLAGSRECPTKRSMMKKYNAARQMGTTEIKEPHVNESTSN